MQKPTCKSCTYRKQCSQHAAWQDTARTCSLHQDYPREEYNDYLDMCCGNRPRAWCQRGRFYAECGICGNKGEYKSRVDLMILWNKRQRSMA